MASPICALPAAQAPEPWGWWLRDKTASPDKLGFLTRKRERLSIAQPPEEWEVTALYDHPAAQAQVQEPGTYVGGSYSVQVCPICDIAGCRHIRATNTPVSTTDNTAWVEDMLINQHLPAPWTAEQDEDTGMWCVDAANGFLVCEVGNAYLRDKNPDVIEAAARAIATLSPAQGGSDG